MKEGFNLKILEERLKAGTIRGFTETFRKTDKNYSGNAGKNIPGGKKGQKIKAWIALNLKYWCEANGLELKEEYRFHDVRKWRFDWAIIKPSKSRDLKIGIEYNGIMSQKSRHTTVTGYSGDMEKINAAQALGWRVFQYTPMNYKQLINDLNRLI